MAGAVGCVSPDPQPAVEPVVLADAPGAAGSLVLRRMDRREHKRGTGAPLGRGFLLGFRSGYSFRPPASIPPKIGPRGVPRAHAHACNRAGLPLAASRPHLPAMPILPLPSAAADRAHEQARRHPERETLELATAGAAKVLGVDPGVTKALARASMTMAKADLWKARLPLRGGCV